MAWALGRWPITRKAQPLNRPTEGFIAEHASVSTTTKPGCANTVHGRNVSAARWPPINYGLWQVAQACPDSAVPNFEL
jgi:hypothetical protein